MALNLNLGGDSIAERVVIALTVLALCAEMLSNNGACSTEATPMTHEFCLEVCGDAPIRRLEAYACEWTTSGEGDAG